MRAAATWGMTISLCGSFWLAAPAFAAPPSEPAAPGSEPHSEVVPESTPEPVPEPTPEPAPTAQPEPQLPAADAPLPSYDELPIGPEASFDGLPIESEDPPTGRGRTALGSMLLGGGAVLMGVSAIMLDLETDSAVWLPGTLIGSAAVVTGVILVVTGQLRHQKYRAWAKTHASAPVPPRGDGLLAGGLTCMIAGSMGTIIGGVSLVAFQDEDDPPYGQVLVPLGLVSVVTGVGLLAVGGKRRKQFDRWQAGTVVPSLALLPGTRASIGGLSLGLAGRF